MSKEGERASVLKTTKVRTKLKGDGSWMQRLSEPQSETEEEKPWMAEVRVNRLNGAPIDTSPVASPTCKTPPSPTRPAEDGGIFTKTDTKPAATSSTFNSLSVSTSSFTKRPSESYKRIAPHTVRPTSNLPVQTEDQLSLEEKEKREEAAMDVLRTSSARQRSYVLSAAKKYDSTEKPLETSLTPDVSSFVAKRVVITDNDDSVFTETPSVPKEPAAPSVKDVSPVCVNAVSPVSVKAVSPVSVKDVSAVSAKDVSTVSAKAVSPVSVKDVSSVSVKAVSTVSVKDVSPVSVKDVSPVSVKAVFPVSVKDVSPVSVKAVSPVSVKDVSPVSVKDVSPVSVKDVSPVSVKDVSPVSVKYVSPVSVKAVSPVPVKAVSPVPVKAVSPVFVKDVSPVSVKAVSPVSVKAVFPVSVKDVSPVSVKDVSPVSVKAVSPVSVKDVSLVSLKDVSPVSVKDVSPVSVKDVSPVSLKDVSPVSVKDVSPVSVKAVSPVSVKAVFPVSVKDVSPVSVKDVSPVSVKDVSPVSLKDVSPVSVKDVSPVCMKAVSPVSVKVVSPVSLKDVSPVSVKVVSPVSVKDVSPISVKDVLLPAPVIVDTPAVIGPSEGMKPGCPKMATPLPELTVGVMKKLSPERGVPLRDIPPVSSVLVSPVPCNPVKKNPAPVDTLTALSDTLISFDTGSSSLEQELVKPIPPIPGSWSQELLSGSDRLSYAESEEEEEDPRDEKPHRDIEVVSPDSPTPSTDSSVNENVLEALEDDFIPINTNTTRLTWKRSWDVNSITTTDKSEEEEPEEQNQQVSLVTVQKQSSNSESPWDRWSAPTVYKETRDPEPSMDRSSSYSRTLDSSANQRPTSPDTESKKGFVYLKEYVNATDLTKHNTRDNVSDYVTSSSTSYSHSSPSSYTRTTTTSACTYCGEQVGNDAKITIEHLNISCHPACFKCGVCSKPMGDFLYNMFLHKGTVHCESCYTNVL
ncbi:mucin-2-like isoform X2 [Salvelinus fontinalis]|uniref:mucin-2-like isoform X2 n=1 Tax=Salvelinus fontinalis TaxID=8038 RepID=UPI0024868EB7|nr:mucin-2-like isoform X2 [Salvelinus fontinalis]